MLTAIVISMAATAVMLALAAVGQDDDTASAEDPERAARMFRGLSTLSQHTDTEQVAKEAEKAAAAKHTPQADTLGAPYGKGGPHSAGNSTSNSKEER